MYKYNHLFFTEKSKDNLLNMLFWQKLSDLEDFYKNEKLTTSLVLRHNARMNYFYEDVLFESESPILLKQANEIYRDHYHISRLELYQDTPEINAELLDEVWREKENS